MKNIDRNKNAKTLKKMIDEAALADLIQWSTLSWEESQIKIFQDGGNEPIEFTAWSESRVYYADNYDGHVYISSVARFPHSAEGTNLSRWV